jgi:hypothetical protein
VFSIFKKKFHTPKERGVYAITKYRRGDFVLFIKKENDETLEFMRLPDCTRFYVTVDDFNSGIVTNLFEWVECLPPDVFEVCVANAKE